MSNLSLKKKTLFTGIVLCFSVIVALILGEVFIRFFSSHGYTTPALRKGETLDFQAALLSKLVLKQEARTIPLWGGKHCHINAKGYRGKEFDAQKPTGTYRIIIYGGSQVFDMVADVDQHWSYLTQLKLHEQGYTNVEVINAGIPGLTAMDSVGRLLGEGHLFQPNCVIICNAWNDIKHFNKTESWIRHYTPHIDYKDFRVDYYSDVDQLLCEFSQLYERLRSRYFYFKLNVGLEGAIPDKQDEIQEMKTAALAHYKLAIETFVDTARNINAVPVLMTQARLVAPENTPAEREKIYYEYQPFEHDTLVSAFVKTDEMIKEIAQEKSVDLIDASSALTGKNELFQDHVHTTVEGSKQLAELTTNFMVTELLNN